MVPVVAHVYFVRLHCARMKMGLVTDSKELSRDSTLSECGPEAYRDEMREEKGLSSQK